MYIRATDGTVGVSSKAEIIFSRECEAVLLKLRNFSGSGMMADKEKLFKSLIPATDGKGKRVRDDLYTTETIELAMERYIYSFSSIIHEMLEWGLLPLTDTFSCLIYRYKNAVLKASCKVYELLRSLSENLKGNLNTVVFISVFSVIAKTLFAHVR